MYIAIAAIKATAAAPIAIPAIAPGERPLLPCDDGSEDESDEPVTVGVVVTVIVGAIDDVGDAVEVLS